ncbi:DUF1045 domain-containing protein [Actibacterium sp. MT2.3-13A]|uniref:DUF1045 domain-containing protein n=1 Tax=Actibacterium sp. MT2.3-13A TaxID=2828332 RepID=UPI001BA9B9B2|nr:DUF1045 domain-containing protein [Actibacterium sp. MT2.3-13A]
MWDYRRYAIYFAPEPGPLAEFGAAWLGWDPATGKEVAHPDVAALPRPVAELTETPRKYGFHGTIKPPFRLAGGQSAQALHAAAQALCARLAPVALEGLGLSRLGAFLALTPKGDTGALAALAAETVRALDRFRAPPSEAEIARRNPARLSPAQRALLEKWGYPYVLGEFRFHLTLTGRLERGEAGAVEAALGPVVAPLLPAPFRVDNLCLFGEAEDGRFHLLHRYALSG